MKSGRNWLGVRLNHCTAWLRNLAIKKIGTEVFVELRNDVLEKISWSVIIEEVLERVGQNKTLLNNILQIKVNWIGHILKRNCLLRDTTDDKSVSSRRKRRTKSRKRRRRCRKKDERRK